MATTTGFAKLGSEGPVYIFPMGWGLTATFLVLFLLYFLGAVLFPGASFTHNWLGLFSTAPVGSARELIEGVIWNIVFAWIAAVVFGLVYNRLAPRA